MNRLFPSACRWIDRPQSANNEDRWHRLNQYSLGTKKKNTKLNDDGSLTLYASAQSPGADQELNWLPAPDGPFSLYVRAYWGTEAILDGSWMPPVVEKVRQLGNAFCQHGGFGECLLMALSGRRARRLSCQLLTHKRKSRRLDLAIIHAY